MAEHASQEIIINAKPAKILEAVLELDEYPLWIPEIVNVKVSSRDERGRAVNASLTSNAMGKTIVHNYVYNYDNYPDEISWTLLSGDMAKSLVGSYKVHSAGENSTTVSYDLVVDMSVSLPGFMKKKAAEKIVSGALENLKKWCEKESQPSNVRADEKSPVTKGNS